METSLAESGAFGEVVCAEVASRGLAKLRAFAGDSDLLHAAIIMAMAATAMQKHFAENIFELCMTASSFRALRIGPGETWESVYKVLRNSMMARRSSGVRKRPITPLVFGAALLNSWPELLLPRMVVSRRKPPGTASVR